MADRDALHDLKRAEQAFEEIRLTLISNLEEPERSAFWKAVAARDELRSVLAAPPSAGNADAVREALESIRIYSADTLSGRTDGPDDWQWQRAAVLEINKRARAALSSAPVAGMPQEYGSMANLVHVAEGNSQTCHAWSKSFEAILDSATEPKVIEIAKAALRMDFLHAPVAGAEVTVRKALTAAKKAMRSSAGPEEKANVTAEIDAALVSLLPTATPAAFWRFDGQPDPHAGRYDGERAALPLGDRTDDELANEVFLHEHRSLDVAGIMAGQPSSIALLTAAKERIRWLSRKLIEATAKPLSNSQRLEEG